MEHHDQGRDAPDAVETCEPPTIRPRRYRRGLADARDCADRRHDARPPSTDALRHGATRDGRAAGTDSVMNEEVPSLDRLVTMPEDILSSGTSMSVYGESGRRLA